MQKSSFFVLEGGQVNGLVLKDRQSGEERRIELEGVTTQEAARGWNSSRERAKGERERERERGRLGDEYAVPGMPQAIIRVTHLASLSRRFVGPRRLAFGPVGERPLSRYTSFRRKIRNALYTRGPSGWYLFVGNAPLLIEAFFVMRFMSFIGSLPR